MKSFIISNLLSLIRCPLALLFLKKNVYWRLLSLTLALISDFLDGFIARKFSATSQLGAFLDPLMDRFYIIFVGSVLLQEQYITSESLLLLISRDLLLIFVGLVLLKKRGNITFKATFFGKVTTVCQFIVLFILTLGGINIPFFAYSFFPLLGILTSIEAIKS